MTKILISVLAIGIILCSCQKEMSESNDGHEPTEDSIPTNGRLVKLLVISGTNNSDTAKTEYSYDLAGNLEIEKTSMKVRLANGSYDVKNFYTRYYRDGVMGKIIKVARKGPYSDNGNNVDTVFDYVTYKSSTSYLIKDINNGARVYEYDSFGRVSGTSEYMHWPNPTDPVRMVAYHIYKYDEHENITERQEYTDQDGNGTFELNGFYKFFYDNKKNPLYSKDDALIEWRWALMSPSNVTKQVNIFPSPGGTDEIITIYEYGADGLPRSGGYDLGSDPIILKYYYE